MRPYNNAHLGVLYRLDNADGTDEPCLRLVSGYADDHANGHHQTVQIGEGLIGQCAADKRQMLIVQPENNTVPISSASFRTIPHNVIVLPVLFENQLKAVLELASLRPFSALQIAFLEQLTDSFGTVLNSIEATMQTEGLLTQSQQPEAGIAANQRPVGAEGATARRTERRGRTQE